MQVQLLEEEEMKCSKFLIQLCFIFTLLLSCCSILTTADTIKVCPEEQLTLECQSSLHNDFILEWNVCVPYCNKTYPKLFSNDGVRDNTTVEIESMVTLSFNRISESGDLPLVSQLSINNVSMNLNETRINCTERDNDSNNNIIILTVIHIINSDFEYPHSPYVQKAVKKSNNNATVMLEWIQEVGVSYTVSVTPNPLESSSSGAKSQLVVLYNTSYHISIVATLCGNNMNRTAFDISIDQPATCQYPALNGSSLHISGDASGVAVVGTTLAFSCSKPGEVIVGANTSTCTDDGKWVPDPNQVHLECKVSCGAPEIDDSMNLVSLSYGSNSTLEGSIATFWCTGHGRLGNGTNTFLSVCHQDGNWMPNPVNQCTTRLSKDDHGMLNQGAVIAGASVSGAVVLILSTFMIVVVVKRVSSWNNANNLMFNAERDVDHDYVVHEHNHVQLNEVPGTTANTILTYADVRPLPARSLGGGSTLILDWEGDRVQYTQLNYNNDQGSNVPVPSSALHDDSTNKESDISLNLDSLLIQLQDKVTEKWYELGVALGIEKEILDRYLEYSSEQNIIEILDYWLRNGTEITWTEVARALRQINYHQLATMIENIDKTGKFPVEVNMTDVDIPEFEGVIHGVDQFITTGDEIPPPIPPRI